ncbi:CdiA family toxin C-terminal domain-containing protein [Bacillus cereus group sp. N21]|nr:CdiA family toxin C-terminal domain-containing protein [Bacillus cereus group sp. N21]
MEPLINHNKEKLKGIAKNGLKFEGLRNLETGEIDNFWPVFEFGNK